MKYLNSLSTTFIILISGSTSISAVKWKLRSVVGEEENLQFAEKFTTFIKMVGFKTSKLYSEDAYDSDSIRPQVEKEIQLYNNYYLKANPDNPIDTHPEYNGNDLRSMWKLICAAANKQLFDSAPTKDKALFEVKNNPYMKLSPVDFLKVLRTQIFRSETRISGITRFSDVITSTKRSSPLLSTCKGFDEVFEEAQDEDETPEPSCPKAAATEALSFQEVLKSNDFNTSRDTEFHAVYMKLAEAGTSPEDYFYVTTLNGLTKLLIKHNKSDGTGSNITDTKEGSGYSVSKNDLKTKYIGPFKMRHRYTSKDSTQARYQFQLSNSSDGTWENGEVVKKRFLDLLEKKQQAFLAPAGGS